MAVRWTVLASGSAGNACLLEIDDQAVLIDAGLGPRQLAARLTAVGAAWKDIRALLLTHTHSDHWRGKTLERLLELRIPLYCHSDHRRELQLQCEAMTELQFAGLVIDYEPRREFSPLTGLRCRALPVNHDSAPTFGFRLEGNGTLFGPSWAIGYATDLGSWSPELSDSLADVDVLALEFNHDVEMQRASGRAPWLIARVLGDQGHLSNVQGAQLLADCLRRSSPRRVQHVIQLHLSRQCNRPSLAAAAARAVLSELAPETALQTAEQDYPGATIELAGR